MHLVSFWFIKYFTLRNDLNQAILIAEDSNATDIVKDTSCQLFKS